MDYLESVHCFMGNGYNCSGIGTVVAVTALADTIFSPYINIHNPVFFRAFIAEQSPQCKII